MKLIFLIAGIGFVAFPFVTDTDNFFVAIFCLITGFAFLSALKDKPRYEYVGTRTQKQHIFRRK